MIMKKALFPLILTLISFILFIALYLYINLTSIEPYYLEGLIFAIPFISFGIITYFTYKGKAKKVISNTITVVLIFVLGFLMLISFIFIAIDAATTKTTDIGKYQKILRITDYPDNEQINYFPEKIPDNAKNVKLSYLPAFIQGGEVFNLKFETDSASIDGYIEKFSNKAIWTGNTDSVNINDYGIHSSTFIKSGYEILPIDFTIYVFISEVSNHGELSLAAVSKSRNEIIFLAEDW